MLGTVLLFSGAVVTAVAVWLLKLLNELVRLSVRTKSSWSDVDVQLKQRHDLILNLVEVVKGYSAHERNTFEGVAKLRSAAASAASFEERQQAENKLSGGLWKALAVAESYPQLRASENFQSLQSRLSIIESGIESARRNYNAQVLPYNTRIQSFPANIVASSWGFPEKPFFEFREEREQVQVKF
ncbi:MAG: LemA family protein [Candidatus Acidiferrales bacterium]